MGTERREPDRAGPLRPTALSTADMARLLNAAAGIEQVTPEQIETDIKAGAPTNADGTLNLVHYTAWLAREMAQGNPRGE